MAPMKLHGLTYSTNTMRVTSTLYEKDLDFEFLTVDISVAAHKKEPFLSLNPFGQVPVLEDGDLKLFESRAITKYIAHEHASKGTQLIPQESKKKATMAVWIEVEAHQFDPPASKLAWELHYKPTIFKQQGDEAIITENESKLKEVLDIYESRLAQSKYLAGDEFTLVDLHHQPNLYFLMGTEAKKLVDERAHVKAWCADILARPAWAKVLDMMNK